MYTRQQTQDDENIFYFSGFISHLMHGVEGFRVIVGRVLKEAQLLNSGKLNFYTVDRHYYYVTVFLAEHARHLLEGLDVDNITNEQLAAFKEVLDKRQVD